MTRTLGRLTGLVFLLVLVLLVYLSIAIYQGDFVSADTVTLEAGTVGNQMHPHADVKLRGVVIGEVKSISADGTQAKLTLGIDPDKLHWVPANVTAQMLPTTLFGERYVSLVPPADPAGTLHAGATISEDRSADGIELEQVFQSTLNLLTAVEPQQLAATLTAFAQALQGRGTELGQTFVKLDAYLHKLNPTLPALDDDLHQLVGLTQAYADAAPQIVQALNNFVTTSKTMVDERANLDSLYSTVTANSQDITTFFQQNSSNIIALAADGRAPLETFAKYSPEFPCVLKTLNDFIPAMDKALGKGTKEHGLHVTVKVVPQTRKYVPGRDTPRYTASGGPACYSTPYLGQTSKIALTSGLGMANSPGENELVDELVGAQTGRAPQSLPDWSSVLLGPAFRGQEVTLR